MAGTHKCGNEHLVFIKCRKFVDQLRTGWLLKKDSVSWRE